MTTTIAHVLQMCFTNSMSTITRQTGRQREDVYTKAKRILSDPSRVQPAAQARPPRFWAGVVVGDHGRYAAFAIDPDFMAEHGITGGRIGCTCQAGWRGKLCSHMIVAEEMRVA